MNNLRNVKILLKASLMKDPEVEMQVKHNKKNLILLDESDEAADKGPKLTKTLTQMMKQKMLGKSLSKKVDLLG